jgi:hypothetical protein
MKISAVAIAIAIANSLKKVVAVMGSFCRWLQWESGAHRLAYHLTWSGEMPNWMKITVGFGAQCFGASGGGMFLQHYYREKWRRNVLLMSPPYSSGR